MFHAVLSSVLNGVCPWIRGCCCPEGCFFQAVGSIDVKSMWSCLVPHLDMMQGLSNTCSFMCLSGPRLESSWMQSNWRHKVTRQATPLKFHFPERTVMFVCKHCSHGSETHSISKHCLRKGHFYTVHLGKTKYSV